VVAGLSPPLKNEAGPGPVVPIWSHGPDALGPRSILKPDSFDELSIQDTLIRVCETAEAAAPVGAIGADWARAKPEIPDARIAEKIVERARPENLNLVLLPLSRQGSHTHG
jgi:hypothetical protein